MVWGKNHENPRSVEREENVHRVLHMHTKTPRSLNGVACSSGFASCIGGMLVGLIQLHIILGDHAFSRSSHKESAYFGFHHNQLKIAQKNVSPLSMNMYSVPVSWKV